MENIGDIDFIVNNTDKIARQGLLKVKNLKVKTPVVFLGYRLGDKPEVWNDIKIQAIMPNAYDLFSENGRTKEIFEKGIHSYLNYKGLVMMDSGGYYFQKEGKVNINAETVLNIEEKASPNIGVVLDFPLDPKNPKLTNERIDYTIKNTKYMLKKAEIPMMPTIHGYNKKDIDYSSRIFQKNIPKMVALGSQAALLYPFRANRIEEIIDIIIYVRRKFPDAFLHVFGLGSPRLIPLLFYVGADSADAKTWLWKAVRHMIYHNGQIVCVKDDSYSWTPYYDGKEYECNCPVCKKEGFEGLMGEKSWTKRAVHNAWKYQEEIKNIQVRIKEGTLDEYVKELLDGTIYMPIFNKIKSKLSQTKLIVR